jgi:regulator of nucleoside diphosphate kinase
MHLKERSVVTNADEQRLRWMTASIGKSFPIIGDPYHAYLRALEKQLAQSSVVSASEVGPDVVTMNSKVRVHELDTGKQRTLTLVYQDEADPYGEKVSVLTPLGASLLGARAGDTIEWTARRGPRRAWIEKIQFQPEAAGEFGL